MDVTLILKDIEDHLFPRKSLDLMERALYHYLFRHTYLAGKDTTLIGLLSVAQTLGISESTVRDRIRSMHEKGCIHIEDRSKSGHLVRVLLPNEIPGVVPAHENAEPVDVQSIDFFTARKYVAALLHREDGRCFYCLREMTVETTAIDHVVAQVNGADHSFRNVVAACHRCNSAKQGQDAHAFLRSRYRQGELSPEEFQDRLVTLEKLQAGQLVPEV